MPDTTRPPVPPGRPSFGIMTAPSQVGYDDLLRVWREADEVPEIEHAWLFDHLMPIWGTPRDRRSRAGRCWRPSRRRRGGCGWA